MNKFYLCITILVCTLIVCADFGFFTSLFCSAEGQIGKTAKLIYAVTQCIILLVSTIVCCLYI